MTNRNRLVLALISAGIVLILSGIIAYFIGTPKAEATFFTHKKWSYYWSEWSECQPLKDENLCGIDEGVQTRTKYRKCVLSLFSNTSCELNEVEVVDTEERACEFEYEPCEQCEQEEWSCDTCQNPPGDDVCYEEQMSYCGEAYGCGWVSNCPENGVKTDEIQLCLREWVCEDTCTPEPEPENGEEAPGIWSPPEYRPNVCNNEGDIPKEPTLLMMGTEGDCVNWRFYQTDPYDRAFFNYGYSPDNLMFGIPDLNNNGKVVDFQTCELDLSNHVWGQVGTERNYCVSYSEVIDP